MINFFFLLQVNSEIIYCIDLRKSNAHAEDNKKAEFKNINDVREL
jgi:hypothetical protein